MVRAIFSQKNLADLFPIQGRILVALLALLGASMASAATEDVAPAKLYESVWQLTQPTKLTGASVTMGPNYANPTYFLRLENGQVIDLPPHALVNLSGLTADEAKDAAEHTRIILDGLAKVLMARQNTPYAVVRGDYSVAAVADQKWLLNHKLKTFDPLAEILNAQPFGAAESDVVLPGEDVSQVKGPQTVRDRLRKFYSFIRDAVYVSTIAAFKNHRATTVENKDKIQEWGIQIAFRGELQLGMGKKNFTRNFPVMLSMGYNREKRTLAFRRGYRKESMADGVGMLAGWKIEFRRYRLFADGADAADPRPNYAKLKGTSWYPPSIPVFSPVADSAPGYQSEGFAIGTSIQNLFLPQTLLLDIPMALLNTVTTFEETQRVYSVPIPDVGASMKRFHDSLVTAGMFTGTTPEMRCESLFLPMPVRRAR